MDGKWLVAEMLIALQRSESEVAVLGLKKIYDCLDEASCNFARSTGLLRNLLTVTTVADQQGYELPPDFIRPYAKGRNQRLLARYQTAADETHWLRKTSFEKNFYQQHNRQPGGAWSLLYQAAA